MDRWVGKVAVVTGASAGIGAATVVELLRHGMVVVGVARRVEKIEALRTEVSKTTNGKLHALKCDIGNEDEVLSVFKWIRENLGHVHVLINNAGVVRNDRLADGDVNLWKQVLNVNVLGLCVCTREAIKLMRETGVDDGHIVHINSIVGHKIPVFPEPTFNMYPASKHAVTAITETLRQELIFLKTKIKVTSISPGVVETEILDAMNAASHEKMSQEKIDMFRVIPTLKSKDVADSVVYVLSTPPHVQIHELIIKPVGEMF